MKIETKVEKFTEALYLESGRILEPYELIYETYGELNSDKSNVIVVCHALTGSHHAAGRYEGDRKAGWWDGIIGEGKAIDTDAHFVICVNVIGSCFGSTGPQSPKYPASEPYRLAFPVITISDMVKAQRNLFTRLGIHHAKAVIGGSMGGMQALCFAVEHPNFAAQHIMLASTYATQPWAIAFNKVAREAILKDPAFDNGNYDPQAIKSEGFLGLTVGRMAGYISYLSPHSMHDKFGRIYDEKDGSHQSFKAPFLVYATGLSKDAKLAAFAVGLDNEIAVFDLEKNSQKFLLKGQKSTLNSIVFYDDETIYSGSDDKSIMKWELKN